MKEINLFCELYINELINNKTILLLNEVYGNEIKNDHQRKLEAERIAREEAEKEVGKSWTLQRGADGKFILPHEDIEFKLA